MKIAFLILAHKNPKQLAQLIEKLKHQNTSVYLHIDVKSDLHQFIDEFEKRKISPTTIFQEVNIVYSSITYIDATLLLLKEATKNECNYFVLLSGLDMPLQPIHEIVSFFERNQEKDFFDHVPIPNPKLEYFGRTRTEFYSFKVRNQMETLFPITQIKHAMSWKGHLLNFWLFVKNGGKTTRKFPLEYTPYYSSQWWNLSLQSAEYILDFLQKNPTYYYWHKNALHPEEMFFQSILLNSSRSSNIINNNLRYIRWKEGKKHPEMINYEELDDISLLTGALFARKFDLKE